ncbi:MAG: hypothetical protein Q9184_005974 [Pyrenodesmia sp. 2 TL-2023]
MISCKTLIDQVADDLLFSPLPVPTSPAPPAPPAPPSPPSPLGLPSEAATSPARSSTFARLEL